MKTNEKSDRMVATLHCGYLWVQWSVITNVCNSACICTRYTNSLGIENRGEKSLATSNVWKTYRLFCLIKLYRETFLPILQQFYHSGAGYSVRIILIWIKWREHIWYLPHFGAIPSSLLYVIIYRWIWLK